MRNATASHRGRRQYGERDGKYHRRLGTMVAQMKALEILARVAFATYTLSLLFPFWGTGVIGAGNRTADHNERPWAPRH